MAINTLPRQAVFRGDLEQAQGVKETIQYLWEEIAKIVNLLANGQITVAIGTHVNRPVATTLTQGNFYWETDRTSLFMIYFTTPGNQATAVWRWVGGRMLNSLANRPSDLGVNDIGFHFIVNTANQNAEFVWTGTAWFTPNYLQETTSALNSSALALMILRHLTTNTPSAAGFGASLLFQLQDTAAETEDAGDLLIEWSTATSGSETANFIVRLRNVGAAIAKKFKVFASGAVELIGKIVLYNNTAPTNGQLLIGNTAGASFDAATLTQASANQVVITNGAGSITLALPQDIHTTATPTFASLTVNDDAYSAAGWNGNNTVPTKNAVRDKIESLLGSSAYTPTNVTTDRSYDADTVVVAELADVVGTLISDLQGKGILS